MKNKPEDRHGITYEKAKESLITLIKYIGDDPCREGLLDTPDRVLRSYTEFFRGYDEDPKQILSTTFNEIDNYDNIIVMKDVRIESYCEHHMVPFIGKIHIGYLPNKKVVGISKLVRVADVYAKRLQIQEKLTNQIANTIMECLQPLGVGVIIESEHQCMSTRGVDKQGAKMLTSTLLGDFRNNSDVRTEFFRLCGL